MVRKELTSRAFGWIAYTLSRSERVDRPGNATRLFDYDQTHVATVVASYEIGAGFEVGARFRYASHAKHLVSLRQNAVSRSENSTA